MATSSVTPGNDPSLTVPRSYRHRILPFYRNNNRHAYEYEARIYEREGYGSEHVIWRSVVRLRSEALRMVKAELKKRKLAEAERQRTARPRRFHYGMLGYDHEESTRKLISERLSARWTSGEMDHTPLGLKRLCRLASPEGKVDPTEWERGMSLRQAWLDADDAHDAARKAEFRTFIDSKRRSAETQQRKGRKS